ncbi:MAG: hybrid sensor histidine kinase/response regulator [Thermostichus sp. DG02_5_bins_236]
MSLIDADIRDYAYQLFVQEAPELLQTIESIVLTLAQERNSADIHTLMRTTHSLKGNAASLGLDTVKALAHRLESAVKALYSDSLEITLELESSFLAASDCLRDTIQTGIQSGTFTPPAKAEAIYAHLEAQLAHVDVEDFILASTSDFGIDLRQSLFEIDVARSLEELSTILSQGDPAALTQQLKTQAQAFADLGQMLELPNFTALSNGVLQALRTHPQAVIPLAQLALSAWRKAQVAVLKGGDPLPLEAYPELVQWSGASSPTTLSPDPPELELESDFEWGSPSPEPIPQTPEPALESDLFATLADSLQELELPSEPTSAPPLEREATPPADLDPTEVMLSPASVSPTPEVTVRVDLQQLDKISAQVGELSISRNQLQMQQDLVRQTADSLKRRLKTLRHQSTQLERIADQLIVSGVAAPLTPTPQDSPSSQESPFDWRVRFDALELDRYSSLNVLIQEMLEESAQIEETLEDLNLYLSQSEQTLRIHAKGLTELNEELVSARMLPMSRVLERLPRIVRDLALAQHKQVQLHLKGSEVLVDKPVLDQLYTPLVHLVRNAVDHGLEPPQERQLRSKPRTGSLHISAFRQGGQVVIQVRDDGRGIDRAAVGKRAVEQGLCKPEELDTLEDATLLNFIFAPGFSTARQVSEVSGRGVGLDSVRAELAAVRGTVSVQSTPGVGTTFTLRIPLTLGLTQLILCEAGRATYAFPVDTVAEILQVSLSTSSLEWQGQRLPIQPLLHLLRYGSAAEQLRQGSLPPEETQTVLICERDGTAIGIGVDRLVAQQELAVKPLGSELAAPAYWFGCTVGATGFLIPILDGWSLGQLHHPGATELLPLPRCAVVPHQKVRLLVIDDSAMMRQTLARQLERAGYEVAQARDGQEAIAQLEHQQPADLILCDVEMPRMNGFEFLNQRRKVSHLAGIPVVMLTSRSGQKHRRLAMQLGANAYLTKPCLEYELLTQVEALLPSR